MMQPSLSFLCLASYFKGNEFLRGLHAAGAVVYLVTSKKLEHEPWAREALTDIFFVNQDAENGWRMEEVLEGMAWHFRSKRIDRIVALDDFDVEKAAFLREYFRIPGMGVTTANHFRDKLAMRIEGRDAGIPVPGFSPLFNDEAIQQFISQHPGPWIVKPRGQASATGMKKIASPDELWSHLESLGGRRHAYLIEQFKQGDVYHVDALTDRGRIVFERASVYLSTPFEVAHDGGIFRSVIVPAGGDEELALRDLNRRVMSAFGMQTCASHTEFIRCRETGEWYFLETASRVGGAHLAEMVEAASGLNLWYEWAQLEVAVARGTEYLLPPVQSEYAGIIVSLTRQQAPDTHAFQDAEICWRLSGKPNHIGFIVRAAERQRVLALLDDYAARIARDFHARAPAPDRPTS
jgi:hypothetical protein